MAIPVSSRACRAHCCTLLALLLNDLFLHVLYLVVDALTCRDFPLNLLDQFLDLYLLGINDFLRRSLLLLLLGRHSLLHLQLFQQLIILQLKLAHLLLLGLKLALQGLVVRFHVVFELPVLLDLVFVLVAPLLHLLLTEVRSCHFD